jgi:FHA domain/zinc-ribbon domain
MISCTNCGTVNQPGSQYCDECGASLKTTASFKVQNGFDSNASPDDQPPMVTPIPAYVPPAVVPERYVPDEAPKAEHTPANITSLGVPAPEAPSPINLETILAVSGAKNEDTGKNVHATLIIERGAAVGTEFQLSTDETFIGRWDADNGVFPDVDLDQHDPEAKVSRRHARIILKDGTYSVEDLGSTNGTFINRGRRLLPGNPNILNDGDELIVGKTFMRFRINK